METRERVASFSILMNAGLALFKFVLGTLSGSVAIVADGIHSTSDVISSVVVLLGLKISQRKSKNFPYGLYKVENIIAIVSAMAIFFAGYEILREAFFQSKTQEMTHILPAILGVALTLVVTYLFSRYEIRMGKAVGSPSLIADGEHIRTDMWSTIVVLVSLCGHYVGFNIDKVAAVVVTLFIAHAGWEILFEGVKVLLDASLDRDTLESIRGILREQSAVADIKSLTGRNSGSYKFIETSLVMKVRDLERAHTVSTRLEQAIKAQIQNVDHILIHYEPVQKDVLRYAVMLDDDAGLMTGAYGHAPYLALFTKHRQTGRMHERKVLENPHKDDDTGKGIALSEFLVAQKVDVLFVKRAFSGKGPEYVLSNAKIDVQLTEETQLETLIQKV
jgi:cation diffusion facilitator family transporter